MENNVSKFHSPLTIKEIKAQGYKYLKFCIRTYSNSIKISLIRSNFTWQCFHSNAFRKIWAGLFIENRLYQMQLGIFLLKF